VPGVANVSIWGQRLRQLHVQIDPNRLRDARLTQQDIISATGDALWVSPLTFLKGSAPGTGGWIDNPNQRLGVHHEMPITTPEDLAKVAVAPVHLLMSGKKMALGEVAETSYAHPLLIGDAVVSGGNGLMLVVEKFPSANTLEVTAGVEKAITELSRGLPGVTVDPNVFRLASYIEESFDNLYSVVLIGALLALFVIGALLFDWRSALVTAITVPLSIIAALVALHLSGATINVMIIAGLVVALAVLIDDAIVDADALRMRLLKRKGGVSLARTILDATLETRNVTIYAALIVVIAVLPIFFMGGLSGAFFEPLALSYLLAVAASFAVAVTVAPILRLTLGGSRTRSSPVMSRLGETYQGALKRSLGAPRAVIAATVVLLVAGIGTWLMLGQSLLPELKERDIVVNWTTLPGTSHEETYRITSRVSSELRSLPGVRNVGAHVGRAITGDQVVGINSAQIWVSIDPEADYEETLAAIQETIDGYPGADRSMQSYLRDKVGEVLTGEGKAIVVRIYGQKRDILRQKADEVRQAIADIPGIVDLHTDANVEEPQVQVEVDLDAAGRSSVKPGDVRRASATIFSGLTVGYLFEEQKIYDVVVWSSPESRNSLTNLEDLWVDRADRHQVRLGDVADVSIISKPTVIRHEQIAPYVDVVANVVGRDLGTVNREIEERLQKVSFPLEYHPELLGEYAERLEAQAGLVNVGIAALIGIFLLLQACFGSWRLAFVAFIALPLSLAGGVVAAFASGGVISLGSIVGLLAVLGVSARNSVLLLTHYQQLEREGTPFGLDLVMRGASDRLSAILTSSLAVIAALVPIAILGEVPGLEIVQPMAIVTIGGLIASSLVALFVIPTLYLIVGARAERQGDLGMADA
jgi:Cu/Ag efflux pump CusA